MVLILCRRSGGTQKKKLNEWGKKWIEVKILCDREVSRNDTGRIKKKNDRFCSRDKETYVLSNKFTKTTSDVSGCFGLIVFFCCLLLFFFV